MIKKYLKKQIIVYFCLVPFLLIPADVVIAEWTLMDSGTTENLNAVWGSASNDVFAVGNGGTIRHYDGTNWSAMSPAGTGLKYNGVWGTSGNDVFVVGDDKVIEHYDGTSWSNQYWDYSGILNAVWESSANDVFAVGDGGTIRHYDGANWSAMSPAGSNLYYNGVWGTSGNDVFIVGDNKVIEHYDGTNWSNQYWDYSGSLNAVWGSSSNDVFAVGDGDTVVHYNGANWSDLSPDTSGVDYNGVWGTSGNDVFAVGWSEIILHYDGGSWSYSSYSYSGSLNAVWGSSANDVFAVGDGGLILHYGGPSTTTTTSIPISSSTTTIAESTTTTTAELTTTIAESTTTMAESTTTTTAGVTTTVAAAGCSDAYPIDCGNGWCCPLDVPICGYGSFEGFCFQEETENTTTTSTGECVYGFCETTAECTAALGSGYVCRNGCCENAVCPASLALESDESQLNAIRDFRDTILTQTPEGQEIIRLYYEWSPAIVKAMEADNALKEEVKEMVDGVLLLIGGME